MSVFGDMATDDPGRHRQRLRKERERLENADIVDRDRDAIVTFVNRRSGPDETSSLVNYSSCLRKSAERCHRPLVDLEDPDDVNTFLAEMRTNPEWGRDGVMKPATRETNIEILRMFLQDLGREWASELEADRPDDEDRAVNPNDMLTEDDIAALLDAADRQRDMAIIEFLADTACRIGMLCSLRIKDVDLDGETATYMPNDDAIGLKGAQIQEYPLIDSKAPVRAYQNGAHPRSNEPEAALFHKFRGYFDEDLDEDDGAMTPQAVTNRLKRIAADAGVEKPVNAHNFKHTAITRMAREGFSKQQIRHRAHWSVDTDMFDQYVHLAAEDVNNDIFEAAGIVEETDEGKRRRKHCGNCNEPIAPHHRHCANCGAPATQPRRELLELVDDLLVEEIADTDDRQIREDLVEVRREARANPSRVPDIARQLFPDHLPESSSDS